MKKKYDQHQLKTNEMSKNRAKLNKATTSGQHKILLINHEYPMYWDDGIVLKRGHSSYQYRSYKTWKHSRKTKWKS